MKLDMDDVAVFIYTVGVLIAGIYIHRTFEPAFGRLGTIGMGIAAAVFFTFYWQWGVLPKLSYGPSPEGSERR